MTVTIVTTEGAVIRDAGSLDSGVAWAEGYTTATGGTVQVIDRGDRRPTSTFVVRAGQVRYEESTCGRSSS